MRRPLPIALARLLNAAFFLATSMYCLLAYSPFAYQQFLKPAVISWVPDFLAIHTALFWLALLITTLTLMDQLKDDGDVRLKRADVRLQPDATGKVTDAGLKISVGSGFSRTSSLVSVASGCSRTSALLARTFARAYVVAGVAAGLWLTFRPLMPSIGNSPRSLVIALLALVPLVWLAIVDHASAAVPPLEPSNDGHLLRTTAVAAVVVWLAYALGAPFTLARTPGVELSWPALIAAGAFSAAAHAFVFMAVFLTLAAITGIAALTRRAAGTEYVLLAAASAATLAAFIYGLAFTSIAFVGGDALAAAAALGATIAAVWSGLARRRVAADRDRTWTPVQLWLAPMAGRGSRALAALVLTLLPVAAYGLVTGTGGLDWNFVIQKSGVLVVWVVAFAAVHALLPATAPGFASAVALRDQGQPPRSPRSPRTIQRFWIGALGVLGGERQNETARAGWWLAIPPCVALALFQAAEISRTHADIADRYASIDMSFRLIRDLRLAQTGETAAFYTFLKANTLVAPPQVTPPEMPRPSPVPAGTRPPHIFLFVIDSLRRDYVAPYNPAVTFTPAIARWASGSFMFERAMTRYAGTALAVPSIWSGGLLIHMIDQQPFAGRNALGALLDTAGYRRVMGVDHVMRDLLSPAPGLVELDRGVPPMECDFCRTLRELRGRLVESAGDARPVFSYTLPQNVHIAVASKREVPAGRSYPGFVAPVAESVRLVDECFGEFIAFLERSGLYDDSIVILTSDHGDSLGEEGRWGHAYFMVPEVMRVPLIIHVPARFRDRVRADLTRVSFSTDITPTLYALLGYDVAGADPLAGSPLLVERNRRLVDRRRQGFLLASSYGAVYGMLGHNGRTLYTADAIDGRDAGYDLTAPAGTRTMTTGAATALNRAWIAEQLRELAARNHFVPRL